MISIPLEPLIPDERLAATAERIAQLEQLAGMRLPAAYRAFLEQHGGSATGDDDGYVVAPFTADGKPGFATVDTFYGFYKTPDDPYDLRTAFRTYAGRVPRGTLPIAQTPGGDQVCVAGDEAGRVLVWHHDRGTEQELGADFSAFLDGLRLEPYRGVP